MSVTAVSRNITLPAPAKLNLFLHVVGRRADGYHLLQTVFQLLDWGDTVTLHLRDDDVIRMTHPLVEITDNENLALRAARVFKQALGGIWGVDISIDKKIPIGGGLGGASSDAASVLLGLNALTGAGFDLDRLASIGLELGADVPVFVRGRSAWADGVGEELTPVDVPERWFAVIFPDVAVSTAKVFADPGLTRNSARTTISHFLIECNAATRNDLEPVAVALAPEIGHALRWLDSRASSRMSGSGSCVFAAFATRAEADAVAAEVPDAWRTFVARGVTESPLHQHLRNLSFVIPAKAGIQ